MAGISERPGGCKDEASSSQASEGEVAVIDHVDLDSTCARMLVERQASAVINASPSISGRYPNNRA